MKLPTEKWTVIVEGHFTTEGEAQQAANAMEDAVGRYNGDLEESAVIPIEGPQSYQGEVK